MSSAWIPYQLSPPSPPPSPQHPPIVVSKEVKVPGGTVFINPSQSREEVGDYVTTEREGQERETSIGVLQMESSFKEIMIRNGSQHVGEDGQ